MSPGNKKVSTVATNPVVIAAAMQRFADATNVYLLALDAARDAMGELLRASAELRALGVIVTIPGQATAAATPAAPNAAPSTDDDSELRAAIAQDTAAATYVPKPPKTGS